MSDKSMEPEPENREVLQLQNQLAELDLTWQSARQTFDKYQWLKVTQGTVIVGTLAMLLFGCYMVALLSYESGIATLALVILFGILLTYAISKVIRYGRYLLARRRYSTARESILTRLQQLKSGEKIAPREQP